MLTRFHAAVPLQRHHMPHDYAISLASYTGRGTPNEQRLPADRGPAQSLRGFEPTYRNIIDYIVRITYRIWEDREVGYIRNTYDADSRIFDDYGLQLGAEKIVSDTTHTTGAFSDIKLIADEVIWAGDDEVGFHTSHRTIIRGTNDGASKYGPATNRYVDVWCIANCVALNNKIFLEHVLYNNSSLLPQLGMDLGEEARRMARQAPAGWPRDSATWAALRAAARPDQPLHRAQPVNGFDPDGFCRAALAAAWANDTDELEKYYAPGVAFQAASGRGGSGIQTYARALRGIRTPFRDFNPQVDEVYWMGNEADGFLCSTRWSADARHVATGIYGEPSGTDTQIWGINQQHIVNGRIEQEWMLFNELDLMMQIEAAR